MGYHSLAEALVGTEGVGGTEAVSSFTGMGDSDVSTGSIQSTGPHSDFL